MKRSVGELVLIVLGVLVALGANSLWEGRKDRGREKLYLQQLLADMRENEKRIQGAIRADSTYLASVERFVEAVFGDEPPTSRDEIEINVSVSSFEPLTATYTALVRNGDVQLVRSDALRLELTSYAALLESVQENLQLTVMQAWDDHKRTTRAEMVHLLPSAEERRLQPEGPQESVDMEGMLSDPDLVSAMLVQRTVGENRLRMFDRLKGPTRRLRCLLEAEPEGVEDIAVRPASASAAVAETTDLEASVRFAHGIVLEGCPVSWTTSDEDVASVEEGTVTGRAEGDVTVTASFRGVSGSAPVTIEPGAERKERDP